MLGDEPRERERGVGGGRFESVKKFSPVQGLPEPHDRLFVQVSLVLTDL